MPSATPKTVRLARGKHSSPEQGVCAMELTSMLAGERFSDRPACVDRVIAAVVRGYNDCAGPERRQDLFAVAPALLGTHGRPELEEARLRRCLELADELHARRPHRRFSRSPSARMRRQLGRTPVGEMGVDRFGHELAVLLARCGDEGHARALALFEELAAIGRPAPAPSRPRARREELVSA